MVRRGVPLPLVGVWAVAVEVDLDGSGVLDGVRRSLDARLFGAKDALDRIVPEDLVSSAALASTRPPKCFRDKLFALSALDFLPPALGRRRTVVLSEDSGAMKVPGPTDFLGALAPPVLALLKEFGGKWLCRLPRSIEVVVPAMGSDLTDVLEVLDAVELLRVTGPTPEPFRAGTGIAACGTGFFCSAAEASVPGTDFAGTVLPLPGRGKWFRLGSVPTIVSWKSSKLKVGSRKFPKSNEPSLAFFVDGFACIDAKLNREMSLMDNSCV